MKEDRNKITMDFNDQEYREILKLVSPGQKKSAVVKKMALEGMERIKGEAIDRKLFEKKLKKELIDTILTQNKIITDARDNINASIKGLNDQMNQMAGFIIQSVSNSLSARQELQEHNQSESKISSIQGILIKLSEAGLFRDVLDEEDINILKEH